MSQVVEKVKQLAEEVCTREGLSLYDVEFVGAGRGRTLRVFIERADGVAVSIDDCANVSRGLNLALDVEDVIPGGEYQLEVSSPGLERVLRQPWHFETAKGKKIQVKTFAPLEIEIAQANKPARKITLRNFSGTLAAVVGEEKIQVDYELDKSSHPVDVDLKNIAKAHVVFEWKR